MSVNSFNERLNKLSLCMLFYNRRANSNADDVEHVVISHNEDDHSYGIDGKVL